MLDGKKIVFYELNEVPFRIIDWFVSARPRSAFAQLLRHGRCYRTYTEDEGHLSPWITWPTLHRGVTNQAHEIYNFGQELGRVDQAFPPIWRMLAQAGRKVGMFGSLHTYPLPDDLAQYAFYVPDTFAAGTECFPKSFEVFQKFNLDMVDRSGRNVTRSIPFQSAWKFLRAAPGLGLRPRTAAAIGHQVITEQFKKERIVRRRTAQSQLSFDFFLAALRKTMPDAAFFFTNHVASSMHRYWPALFPHDYQQSTWPDTWREMYGQKIPYAMTQADQQVRDLMNFVMRHRDYTLLIVSSMGQAAVEGSKIVRSELNMADPSKFMHRLGLAPDEWSRRRAMVPRYVFAIAEAAVNRFRAAAAQLTVNGRPIRFSEHERGVFMVHTGLKNFDDRTIDVRLRGEALRPEDLGLINRRIQDEAGSNAFHIPEGSMIVFDPQAHPDGAERPKISTREVAPSLLRNFGITPPGYMQRPSAL